MRVDLCVCIYICVCVFIYIYIYICILCYRNIHQAVQHRTLQYNTLQYSTAPYSAIHYTVPTPHDNGIQLQPHYNTLQYNASSTTTQDDTRQCNHTLIQPFFHSFHVISSQFTPLHSAPLIHSFSLSFNQTFIMRYHTT